MDVMVFQIQRFCIDDGPGIRTTVFLKGCSLRCSWCHNAESYSSQKELGFYQDKCLHCGACQKICQRNAHRFKAGVHTIDRELCSRCGACVGVCPVNALKMCGVSMSPQQVMEELRKDREFYRYSGGGITLSGGEPLLQADFCRMVLKQCKEEGIHTAVETAGHASWENIEGLLPWVDLWLYDWKESDKAAFEKYTGGRYEVVEENLSRLSGAGGVICLRCPIIPGVNDRTKHFDEIKKLKQRYKGIQEIQIMPYHRIGEYKKQVYGIKAPLEFPLPAEEEIKQWKEWADESNKAHQGNDITGEN